MTTTVDSDTLQQIADQIGQEPCIVGCGNTGPSGLCNPCRQQFLESYPGRDAYERAAFGVDEKERSCTDRIANLVFGPVIVQVEALGEHLEDPRDDKPEMDAPLARTSPEGFPLTEDGEFDVASMTPQQLGDFWVLMDAKERTVREFIGNYKNAARRQIEAVLRERRAANPKAVEIPHQALLIAMQDDFSPYRYDAEMLEQVKAILPEDDFAKIAKWIEEKVVTTPAHWEVKSTAHATVNAYINKWDGTPQADLLRKFMTRDFTGQSLKIEYRKGVKVNVTPEGAR